MASFLSHDLVEKNFKNILVTSDNTLDILQYAEKDLGMRTKFVSVGTSVTLT